MAVVKKEFKFGDHTVKLETGEIARQASGAVIASMGDTVVLVTVVFAFFIMNMAQWSVLLRSRLLQINSVRN